MTPDQKMEEIDQNRCPPDVYPDSLLRDNFPLPSGVDSLITRAPLIPFPCVVSFIIFVAFVCLQNQRLSICYYSANKELISVARRRRPGLLISSLVGVGRARPASGSQLTPVECSWMSRQ